MELRRFRGLYESGAISLSEIAKETGLNRRTVRKDLSTHAPVAPPRRATSGRPRKRAHIAQALGHLAVRQGAHVRFAKASRILADLAGGHADRTWEKLIRELIRPDVLILDDFAMRQLSPAQTDDLHELVSERQGRWLIITSNRAPSDWYPLFPTPVVTESLLGQLINTSHQVIMNGPSYRPNKRPKNPTDRPIKPSIT
ncbi:ATP-binding protein [Streptomyces sp. NPDC086077]|uniref:ATP-binding protein n=1 Tax=Streptomyces sp. NPDC086077 TaxID=3154862 RepID=UPI00341EC6EE